MSDLTVARRYAQALYEEAAAREQTDAVDADVDLIRRSMQASRELVRVFESPVLPRPKKEKVLRALFADRIQPLTLRFLDLLIEKEREDVFPRIVEAYRTLRDRQMGVVEARARVAGPLEGDDRDRLVQVLERLTGRRVRLDVEQDAGLLGGMVVRVGDTVYDGSVRHQLATLREQMEYGSSFTNGR